MAQSFDEQGPVRTRNVSCLVHTLILVAVAVALFMFRDRWLPKVSELFSRPAGTQTSGDTGDEESITVYVLPEGFVHHRAGCSLTREKGTVNAVNLKQARVGNYRPCTKCNPPR